MSEKTKLPALRDLISDVSTYEKSDEFNFLLNQEPPAKWVKEHPYIRNHKYLPIDKVEYLLRKIFKRHKIEILREGQSFNGVYVVARVHYFNPVTDSWDYHDGIGAINLQLRKQTEEEKKDNIKVDFNTININNGALSMAFPLAKTLAIKDACDMFGKLFGADLNRRDSLPASIDVKKKKQNPSDERVLILLNDIKCQDDLDYVKGLKEAQSEEFLSIIKEKQKQLNKKA